MLLEEQEGNLELKSQALKIKIDEEYKQYCRPTVAFFPSINNKPDSKVPNNLPAALAIQ